MDQCFIGIFGLHNDGGAKAYKQSLETKKQGGLLEFVRTCGPFTCSADRMWAGRRNPITRVHTHPVDVTGGVGTPNGSLQYYNCLRQKILTLTVIDSNDTGWFECSVTQVVILQQQIKPQSWRNQLAFINLLITILFLCVCVCVCVFEWLSESDPLWLLSEVWFQPRLSLFSTGCVSRSGIWADSVVT